MINADIIIIGAGFAGAATAWHLAGQKAGRVIILEREELPGMHASGQNASTLRQIEEDEVISRCAFKGAGFILMPPLHWGGLVKKVGSLMLFKKTTGGAAQKMLDVAGNIGLDSKVVNKKDVGSRVPLLIDADFDSALWTSTDGVIDINELLWSYLRDAKKNGTELVLKHSVTGIKKNRDGTFLVTTEKESYCARHIVNAAGAWALQIALMAGALDIKIIPYRRHLYNTVPMNDVDVNWPFVWDIDDKYYFRPESGGLLLSPCDEEEVPPGIPSTSHSVREMLAEKLARSCPRLANLTIAKEWAGLRTFSPDRRFVIGADPKLEGFYWAAALGGSGVTCSHEVGRMVTDAMLNKGSEVPKEFGPARFL